VSARGADPAEPADPWTQPSGVITFTYTGADLLLQLALGDYWGYLYATVDGLPANQLILRESPAQPGQPAGYMTLYAPELHEESGPVPHWITLHRGEDASQSHEARIEVWRSWTQIPLRAVAIDAQVPSLPPRWPFSALLVSGIALLLVYLHSINFTVRNLNTTGVLSRVLAWLTGPVSKPIPRQAVALLGLLLIAAAIMLRVWWLGPLGLALGRGLALCPALLLQPDLTHPPQSRHQPY
jgi:hypothetical protein